MIHLTCPACENHYRVKDELAGRKKKCPKCGQTLRVPAVPISTTQVPTKKRSIQPRSRNAGNISDDPESVRCTSDPVIALRRPSWIRRRAPMFIAISVGILILVAASVIAGFWSTGFRVNEQLAEFASANRFGESGASQADTELRAVLEKGFAVKGHATIEELTEPIPLGSVTFQRVRLALQLINGTELRIALGQTMMLVETDANGSEFEGVLAGFRLPPEPEEGDRWDSNIYGLSTQEARYADGNSFTSGGMEEMLYLNQNNIKVAAKADVVPPVEMQANTSSEVALTFNQGTRLKTQLRNSVRLALPEIRLAAGKGSDRYRLVVEFKNSLLDEKRWEVDRHHWVRLDERELVALLDQTNDGVTHVLALNWWTEFDPASARRAAAKLGKSLQDGKVLHVCFHLLHQHKDSGLADHAKTLLQTSTTPKETSVEAISYLAGIGGDPELSILVDLASGNDDDVARLAIRLLGQLKTRRSIEALEALLRNSSLSKRHEQIRSKLD